MSRPSRLTSARILLGLIGLVMAGALIIYTFNTYLVSEAAVGTVHVYPWVPYVTAALVIVGMGCTVRTNETRRVRWLVLACLGLVFFGMSLRTLKFYVTGGEIYETWPTQNISRGILVGLNDQQYCYQKSFPYLEVNPSKYGKTLQFFDGIWPSSFSEDSLRSGFLGAGKPCSTPAGSAP